MRAGYKQTILGVIPEDWNIDAIENVAEITTGGKNTQDRISDGEYPFFVRSQTVERINSYSFDGEAVLTAGDGVGTGKVFHYINGKFDAHQRVYQISKFNELVSGYFFYLYFSNYFYNRIMQMTAKSSVDSVRREMIAKMVMPLPPIDEQTAIANALSDADALIGSLQKLIAKKRQIKQGAMQTLLNPYENGVLKAGWMKKKLGNLGPFSKGSGVKKDESLSGDLPCIRYGEIYTRHDDCIRQFYSFISMTVAGNAKRLKTGDLLFAGSGETKEDIGKCVAFLDHIEAYAGGDIVVLSPENVDSMYLGYYLNTRQVVKQKSSLGQGDAVVHISASALGDIDIFLPILNEQTRIATILSDMDAEITALENKLAKYQQIKQGMMQNLLTGGIRLV